MGDSATGYDLRLFRYGVCLGYRSSLEKLCREVDQRWAKKRGILGSIHRSCRATDPENYDVECSAKHAVVKRRNRWEPCERRRLAAVWKTAHANLANCIWAQGRVVIGEKLCYKGFQNRFGPSVKVNAPGVLVEGIYGKAGNAGVRFTETDLRKTRLGRFDRLSRHYGKKALPQTRHLLGDGRIDSVQRDLSRVFLAKRSDPDFLNIDEVRKGWAGAEWLLRPTMLRVKEPARRAGFARLHVVDVRAGPPWKGKTGYACRRSRSGQAGDAVTQAKAPESWTPYSLEPPGAGLGRVQTSWKALRIFLWL
ncbi:hypothetical protein [Candidatus Methylacidithermus pantelleriae]|uniref:hypothetical protein n=1 Tax=Candidatus Methylacidithermus pantelleriae TaxID=2744239 RepID=UPI001BD3B701|nr:hypothetical protein [Candidatus Methylacidithermus pantelleriae]